LIVFEFIRTKDGNVRNVEGIGIFKLFTYFVGGGIKRAGNTVLTKKRGELE